MSVDLNRNDELGDYELGATVDGVFIPFITRPITDVEARIAAVRDAAAASGQGAPAPAGGTSPTTTAAPGATAGNGGETPSNTELEAEVEALRTRVAELEGEQAPPPATAPAA